MEEKIDLLIQTIEKLSKQNWVDYLLVIIPILISIFALFISISTERRNFKLQQDSFCFQLYEKRLFIFESIDEILSRVIREAKVNNEDLKSFLVQTRNVKFLFGKDMAEECSDIYEVLNKLNALGKQIDYNIEHKKIASNHSDLCDQESDLLNSITEHKKKLSDIAMQYISFSNYKIQSK